MTLDAWEFDEIKVGDVFYTGPNSQWRVTDKGQRVVVAVKIRDDGYPSPQHAPPFADATEHVFDEYDHGGMFKHPQTD
jgi:hypothetical protein